MIKGSTALDELCIQCYNVINQLINSDADVYRVAGLKQMVSNLAGENIRLNHDS